MKKGERVRKRRERERPIWFGHPRRVRREHWCTFPCIQEEKEWRKEHLWPFLTGGEGRKEGRISVLYGSLFKINFVRVALDPTETSNIVVQHVAHFSRSNRHRTIFFINWQWMIHFPFKQVAIILKTNELLDNQLM